MGTRATCQPRGSSENSTGQQPSAFPRRCHHLPDFTRALGFAGRTQAGFSPGEQGHSKGSFHV